MNTQCPRCLSSSFQPVMADWPPSGYRVLGVVPQRQVGCAFCDGAIVTKTGPGFATHVRVERQPDLAAVQ